MWRANSWISSNQESGVGPWYMVNFTVLADRVYKVILLSELVNFCWMVKVWQGRPQGLKWIGNIEDSRVDTELNCLQKPLKISKSGERLGIFIQDPQSNESKHIFLPFSFQENRGKYFYAKDHHCILELLFIFIFISTLFSLKNCMAPWYS
jgi:hypothetical protein